MSFAKELEQQLLSADVLFIKKHHLDEYDKGQIAMLNRVMVVVQQQLIKEITQ